MGKQKPQLKVSELAKKPSGLLRKRLREECIKIRQGEGLPDAEFYCKALDGDQFNLVIDEASTAVKGAVPHTMMRERCVKYGVTKVVNLYDEDGELAEVEMEKYSIFDQQYECLPDEIVRMLPYPVIAVIAAAIDQLSELQPQEKKDMSFSGGLESEGSNAQPRPGQSEGASPVTSAEPDGST